MGSGSVTNTYFPLLFSGVGWEVTGRFCVGYAFLVKRFLCETSKDVGRIKHKYIAVKILFKLTSSRLIILRCEMKRAHSHIN